MYARFKELVERSAHKSGAEAPIRSLLEEVLGSVTQDWMKQIEAKEHEVKAAQHLMKAAQQALKEAEKERYDSNREREELRNALPVCSVQAGLWPISHIDTETQEQSTTNSFNCYAHRPSI